MIYILKGSPKYRSSRGGQEGGESQETSLVATAVVQEETRMGWVRVEAVEMVGSCRIWNLF